MLFVQKLAKSQSRVSILMRLFLSWMQVAVSITLLFFCAIKIIIISISSSHIQTQIG